MGWKPQHAGTMHSISERNVRRRRTSRPQSTEVAVSIMWSTIGPLWLPKSIMVLIFNKNVAKMKEITQTRICMCLCVDGECS